MMQRRTFYRQQATMAILGPNTRGGLVMDSRMLPTIKVEINPSKRIEEVQGVLKKVAIEEMSWPADDLIAGIIEGRKVPSTNFVAVSNDIVVGATKVLTSRPFQMELAFPEVTKIIDESEVSGKVVEVALTGVAKEFRGDLTIMLSIYKALYHWSRREGITEWFTVQEKQVTRLYRRLGLPFKELSTGKHYWGGISYPCVLSVSEAERQVKLQNPRFWTFIQEGIDNGVA